MPGSSPTVGPGHRDFYKSSPGDSTVQHIWGTTVLTRDRWETSVSRSYCHKERFRRAPLCTCSRVASPSAPACKRRSQVPPGLRKKTQKFPNTANPPSLNPQWFVPADWRGGTMKMGVHRGPWVTYRYTVKGDHAKI